MPSHGRSVLPVFLVCAFVMDLCILMVRPTVPLLASSLGASPLVVGMIAATMLADSSGDGRDRAMTKFSLSWSAGTMVGPVIAGALLGASMRFGLVLSAAAGLSGLSFLLVLFSGVQESPSSSVERRAEEPKAPASLFYLSLTALLAAWMTQTTSYTFFPLIASGAGMPPPSSWEGFCSS